eukprot:TRINITY_DN1447_c0_g1_i2.p2 TRINITY_DN1447_c0_g1~~TRINITY_DN1447_c0_g1_i2.p2  ORF type:complete len:248 (+),score=50.91 TRINITY_DN1447_c0_g1_i2:411-1154(+)
MMPMRSWKLPLQPRHVKRLHNLKERPRRQPCGGLRKQNSVRAQNVKRLCALVTLQWQQLQQKVKRLCMLVTLHRQQLHVRVQNVKRLCVLVKLHRQQLLYLPPQHNAPLQVANVARKTLSARFSCTNCLRGGRGQCSSGLMEKVSDAVGRIVPGGAVRGALERHHVPRTDSHLEAAVTQHFATPSTSRDRVCSWKTTMLHSTTDSTTMHNPQHHWNRLEIDFVGVSGLATPAGTGRQQLLLFKVKEL